MGRAICLIPAPLEHFFERHVNARILKMSWTSPTHSRGQITGFNEKCSTSVWIVGTPRVPAAAVTGFIQAICGLSEGHLMVSYLLQSI